MVAFICKYDYELKSQSHENRLDCVKMAIIDRCANNKLVKIAADTVYILHSAKMTPSSLCSISVLMSSCVADVGSELLVTVWT